MVFITWKNLGHEKNIFLMTFKIKAVLPVHAPMVLNFLELVNNFIETSKNIKDHNSKLFKIFENHRRTYKKYWFVL